MNSPSTSSSLRRDWTSICLGSVIAVLGFLAWGDFLPTGLQLLRMAPGAAMGFFVAGAALATAGAGHPRAANLLAALLALSGAGALSFYVIGWSLQTGWSSSEYWFPRISPTAGLCFLLVGAALWVAARPFPAGYRALVAILAGVSTVGVAGIALTLNMMEDVLGFAAYREAAMTLPTSVFILLLGVGVLLLGCGAGKSESASLKLPVMIGLAAIFLSLTMGQVLRSQQRTQILRTITVATEGLREQLRLAMNARLLAVSRFVDLLARAPDKGELWQEKAPSQLKDYAGLVAVAHIRPSMEVDFVIPSGIYGNVVRSWLESVGTVTPMFGADNIDLAGGRGLVVYDRLENELIFDGYHVCIFRYGSMLDGMLQGAAPGYSVAIYSGGALLYQSDPEQRPVIERQWSRQTTLDQFGLSWQVVVWPTAATLRASRSPLPVVSLLVGNTLGLLLALSVQLAYTARRRAGDIEQVNRELENEMSGRRRAEEQLRQSQKMEAVGRMAGGVAHDFNNLITVVHGYAELLLPFSDHEAPRRYVAELLKAAERAKELTNQLLAFSRRQVLQPRVLDVNQVVRDVRGMLQRLIGEDITLITETHENPIYTKADLGQLQQVVINLVVNARDAMPEGGMLTIRSMVSVLDEPTAQSIGLPIGDYADLTVHDTGVGMDKDKVANIFEPFFTTKERGRGTGLGLSTVYGIIKQSGGGIHVSSSPGGGTTFRIYLPLTDEDVAEREALEPEELPISLGWETVLLVEDEDAVRELAEEVLRAQGYKVLVADGGKEALEKVEGLSDPIHILITDVVMPGMGGPKLAEILGERRPGVPVLFVSGYSEDAHASLRPTPGRAFLSKPFSTEDLIQKVRQVLDAAEAATQ